MSAEVRERPKGSFAVDLRVYQMINETVGSNEPAVTVAVSMKSEEGLLLDPLFSKSDTTGLSREIKAERLEAVSYGEIIELEYGYLSPKERPAVRHMCRKLQGDKCIHCGQPLTLSPAKEVTDRPVDWERFPKGFEKYPVHLHHDHFTGRVIGAVHMKCNADLFLYFGE